jgi:hypothetical protein
MILKKFTLFGILLLIFFTVPQSIIAQNKVHKFEGKFLKIEKLNQKEYYLYLKNERDSTVKFLTIMPLEKHEIKLLRKKGNNISLTYTEFYNPVRKVTDKIVKCLIPLYDSN